MECSTNVEIIRYIEFELGSDKGSFGHLNSFLARLHTKIQTQFSQKILCRSEPNFV